MPTGWRNRKEESNRCSVVPKGQRYSKAQTLSTDDVLTVDSLTLLPVARTEYGYARDLLQAQRGMPPIPPRKGKEKAAPAPLGT